MNFQIALRKESRAKAPLSSPWLMAGKLWHCEVNICAMGTPERILSPIDFGKVMAKNEGPWGKYFVYNKQTSRENPFSGIIPYRERSSSLDLRMYIWLNHHRQSAWFQENCGEKIQVWRIKRMTLIHRTKSESGAGSLSNAERVAAERDEVAAERDEVCGGGILKVFISQRLTSVKQSAWATQITTHSTSGAGATPSAFYQAELKAKEKRHQMQTKHQYPPLYLFIQIIAKKLRLIWNMLYKSILVI